jgi:hypothetical protein
LVKTHGSVAVAGVLLPILMGCALDYYFIHNRQVERRTLAIRGGRRQKESPERRLDAHTYKKLGWSHTREEEDESVISAGAFVLLNYWEAANAQRARTECCIYVHAEKASLRLLYGGRFLFKKLLRLPAFWQNRLSLEYLMQKSVCVVKKKEHTNDGATECARFGTVNPRFIHNFMLGSFCMLVTFLN